MHKPNFKSSHLSKFNSLLHRGQKSKDPYNNRRLSLSSVGLLLKTLGTGSLSTRCSSTFNSDSKFNNYINNSKNLRIAGFSAAFILLILSALTIYPIVKNLNTVEAAEAKNSTTSLSITSTNSASVELLIQSSSGTFATSSTSQKLNFGVTTDNYAGYKLTLLGKDSSYANLKNSSTNANLTSIDSSKASSAFSNGYWGYTLDDDNTYLPAPNNTTGYTIDTTSSPNASTAKTYTLGVGAKADYSTKAGTYTNTYVLTAVGNGTPYVIYYKDNTNDSSVSNLPTTQDESTTAINVNLSSMIPTRTGYTFSKWCDGTVSNDGTSCSGTLYSASASFGIDRTAASNITTLYAVWTVDSYTLNITNNNTTSNPATSATINFGGETTITVTPNAGYYLSEVSCPTGYTCSGYSTGSDATGAQTVTVKNNDDSASATGGTVEFTAASAVDGYLQDFTAAECSAMTTGSTKKLGDTRDGQAYQVAKLADGNCWMDNLNLTSPTVDLTSSNTNLSISIGRDTFVSWGKTSGSLAYDSGEFISVSGTDSTSSTSYGTLYNYYAASAGTIYGDSNSNNAAHDICPKGWRLPTGGSSSEFQELYDSGYNSATKIHTSVANGGAAFALAGIFGINQQPARQDVDSAYWSSTRSNESSMFNLYFNINNSSIKANDSTARFYGISIRCIKKSASEEMADKLANGDYTMQEIGAMGATERTALLSAMTANTSYPVTDARDGADYTMAKINGNVWMTRNLRLAGGTEITSENSNISADSYTLPTDSTSGFNDYATANMHCSDNASTGCWYNYTAATAGTISGDSNATDVTQDICPNGWRLPTKSNFSGITSYKDAFAPVAGGYYGDGNIDRTGNGYWWAATSNDAKARYYMGYDGGMLYANYGNGRTIGLYVRCILETRTIADVTNMQDVTAKIVDNTAELATATLTDSRDTQKYTVAKINGNLWMTRNLAIGCNGSGTSYGSGVSSKTLTSANSNVSSNYTTPTSSGHSNTYTEGKIVCNSTYGAWYNYFAASAGTISGDNDRTEATSSICPKGWRLPTGGGASSDFGSIMGYAPAFIPVAGGNYWNGSLENATYAKWWSSTNNGSSYRHMLDYENSSNRLSYGNSGRTFGNYVRCIRAGS